MTMTALNTLMMVLCLLLPSVWGLLGCDDPYCRYNTDCQRTYTSELDQCYMREIDAWDGANEGFCWGGDAWCNGNCRDKQTLGAACQNAAGNYDNNNCVTGLCSSTTGKCEVRTAGCQSLAACVDMGASVALALAEYTANAAAGWVVSLTNLIGCADGQTVCSGNMGLTISDGNAKFSVSFEEEIADGLITATGEIYLQIATSLNLDADITAPMFKLAVPDVILGLSLEVSLPFEASKEKELFSKDFVLSDELGVCKDPFNKKRACNPYMFFERVIKMGYATVDIEIGFQIVGAMSATISAESDFTLKFTVEKEITAPEVGVQVSPDGFTILGLNEAWNQIANTNWLDEVDVTVEGGVTVAGDFELNFGPQLFVVINGVQFQGGLDFVFKAGLEFTASADTGCASGGASMAFGLLLNFYSPPFDLEAGAKAACTATVGAAQEVIDIVQDITYDKYGTACAVQYLDYCDDRFDLCEEAAGFVGDLMGPLGDFATSDIFLCEELASVSIDLSSGFNVNGETCNEVAEVAAVTCFEEARPFSGKSCPCSGSSEGACGVDTFMDASPQHSTISAKLLTVVALALFFA